MNAIAKIQRYTEGKRKLPYGWRWVRLGDVCKLVGGSTPDTGTSDYWDGEIIWVTPTDLGKLSDIMITTTDRRITPSGLQSCGTEMLPIGTVIMSSRAPIGHLSIAGVSLCTNQGCKGFVPGPDVDSVYLYWTLKHSVPDIQSLGSGATFAEVSKSALQRFEIPLPPLPEQKRIAGMMREQMATVEKARAAAQVRLAAVKDLPAAFLRQVFPKPDTPLPDSWRFLALGDAGEVVSGVTIGRALNGEEIREVPYLRVANVKDGYLDLLDVVTTPATPDEIEALKLKQGDLLLTEGGDPDKLGRGTLWEGQLSECIHQNHIFRVRLDRNLVVPKYASVLIGSSYGKSYFLRHAKQTTGIATINQRVLKAFPILLPPLPEQQRIASVLQEQMAAVEKARAAAEAELGTINTLPAALLRRAFNGEL